MINIRSKIVYRKEHHKQSGQDQDKGKHIVLETRFQPLSQIILRHLLSIIQQQHPFEIIYSIYNEGVLGAHQVLLYSCSNTIDSYQLEEVSCGVFPSIFLKAILNIPVCLTFRQSLEVVF